MTNRSILDESPLGREPAAVTLTDLIALVVGVAIVLKFPWNFWPDPRDRVVSSSWLSYVWLGGQIVELSCLALIPVILLRRARFGGLIRPSEFLTACCGLPALTWGTEILLISAFVSFHDGIELRGPGLRGIPRRTYWLWQNGYHWTWEHGLLIAAFIASTALILGRRRLRGSLRSVLLLIAWLGLYEAAPWILGQSTAFLVTRFAPYRLMSGMNGLIVGSLTRTLPRFLLFSIPFLVAFESLRKHKHTHNWLESMGMIFSIVLFLVAETLFLARNSSDFSPLSPWIRETFLVHVLAMLASVSLGLVIARQAGPPWMDATHPIDVR